MNKICGRLLDGWMNATSVKLNTHDNISRLYLLMIYFSDIYLSNFLILNFNLEIPRLRVSTQQRKRFI